MLNRRDAMLRLGQIGLGSFALPELLAAQSVSSRLPTRRSPAKSCILLYLWGGPSQQDMWDMKPDAPDGMRSLFRPMQTAVPGIHLCDQMPLLARHTDKIAFIRSMSHPSTVHEPSVYHTLTGKRNDTLISPRNMRRRTDAPNVASFVSALTPPGAMPAAVTIPRPIGHDGVTYSGTYAGWLGPRHDPMELREAPNSNDRAAHPLDLAADMNSSRLIARRGLLSLLDENDRILQSSRATEGLGGFHEQAHRMLASAAARRAFNLELEPSALRERYGRNEYGESFLLARRLIESGVRLVSVIWMYFMSNGRIANVWDTHGGTAGLGNASGFEMLKANYCIPPLDRAYSALLEDLHQRGLLEETLVVTTGEFGRTPRLNPTLGREHWGPCYTALLAGGGIRGGQVYGASDRIGAFPRDNPVSPEDLLATVYHALGIASDTEVHDREGRPARICDGRVIMSLF
ncbi:MAG: DUF1501 domain-containing protein [Planctomycetes bacterium]|nr:DUF1501 domain-containing protein [Planctomycetota bacterium]